MSTFLCTVSTNIYQDHVTHLLFRGDPLDHKQHDLISNLDHHYSIKIIENGWLLRHSYPMRIINCIGNLQSFGNFGYYAMTKHRDHREKEQQDQRLIMNGLSLEWKTNKQTSTGKLMYIIGLIIISRNCYTVGTACAITACK